MIQKTLCVCIVAWIMVTGLTIGQDAKADPLQQKLESLIASRQKIRTYQVKLHGVKAVRNSLTSTGHEINAVTEIHLEVAANREEGRYVLIAQTESLFPGLSYRPAAPYALSDVYLINKKACQRLFGKELQSFEVERVHYPEPLALGMGFCAEVNRFTPFDDAAANLKSWSAEGMTAEQRGPLYSFRTPIYGKPNLSTTHIVFDTSRDCIVRSIGMRSGRNDDIGALDDVEPVQVDGHWLPKRVSYHCGSDFVTWELDWVSVNKPLPADLFDADTLQAMAGGAE